MPKCYYCKEEKEHIAKTPLHIARWAIQNYTNEDDWVLDPTMGAGTTAVEAIILKRNSVGIEIEAKKTGVRSGFFCYRLFCIWFSFRSFFMETFRFGKKHFT